MSSKFYFTFLLVSIRSYYWSPCSPATFQSSSESWIDAQSLSFFLSFFFFFSSLFFAWVVLFFASFFPFSYTLAVTQEALKWIFIIACATFQTTLSGESIKLKQRGNNFTSIDMCFRFFTFTLPSRQIIHVPRERFEIKFYFWSIFKVNFIPAQTFSHQSVSNSFTLGHSVTTYWVKISHQRDEMRERKPDTGQYVVINDAYRLWYHIFLLFSTKEIKKKVDVCDVLKGQSMCHAYINIFNLTYFTLATFCASFPAFTLWDLKNVLLGKCFFLLRLFFSFTHSRASTVLSLYRHTAPSSRLVLKHAIISLTDASFVYCFTKKLHACHKSIEGRENNRIRSKASSGPFFFIFVSLHVVFVACFTSCYSRNGRTSLSALTRWWMKVFHDETLHFPLTIDEFSLFFLQQLCFHTHRKRKRTASDTLSFFLSFFLLCGCCSFFFFTWCAACYTKRRRWQKEYSKKLMAINWTSMRSTQLSIDVPCAAEIAGGRRRKKQKIKDTSRVKIAPKVLFTRETTSTTNMSLECCFEGETKQNTKKKICAMCVHVFHWFG